MMDKSQFQEMFSRVYGAPSDVTSSAPGRIEFIGNHTDYNGGNVLGLAIDRRVVLGLRRRIDKKLRFLSEGYGSVIEVDLDGFKQLEGPESWINYPLGVLNVLLERGVNVDSGFDLMVTSNLPSGAGLSSSAAMELASLEAISQMYGGSFSKSDKVLLSQQAENEFVGVPCGMLDQACSCFGLKNHLVKIDCASVEFSNVSMEEGLHYWIFNTNEKHSLVDSLYSERHKECRQVLSLIREIDPDCQHLALAHPGILDQLKSAPAALLDRAKHVISEQLRVSECIRALEEIDLTVLGDLIFASHESSKLNFQNSTPSLDCFVNILSQNRENGVIGARLTGGGFGGAVMALTTSAFSEESANGIIEKYMNLLPESEKPSVFHVQSDDGSRLE